MDQELKPRIGRVCILFLHVCDSSDINTISSCSLTELKGKTQEDGNASLHHSCFL